MNGVAEMAQISAWGTKNDKEDDQNPKTHDSCSMINNTISALFCSYSCHWVEV